MVHKRRSQQREARRGKTLVRAMRVKTRMSYHHTGQRGTERVALGLAISGALLKPGETRTMEEIAAFCGCSRQNIDYIEKTAIRKVRKALGENKTLLRDLGYYR